ncbi:MAG: hypothetical protein ACI8UO_006784 [Verrucomicrobiales bacterium]|jgi:hypothetical protein
MMGDVESSDQFRRRRRRCRVERVWNRFQSVAYRSSDWGRCQLLLSQSARAAWDQFLLGLGRSDRKLFLIASSFAESDAAGAGFSPGNDRFDCIAESHDRDALFDHFRPSEDLEQMPATAQAEKQG